MVWSMSVERGSPRRGQPGPGHAGGGSLPLRDEQCGRPPAVVADHLRELGIAAADDEVVTSAQEGAELLASRLAAGAQVLAVGGPGVSAALVEVGLVPVNRYDVDVVGVLQGFGPDVGWRDLAEASYAVTGGAVWVATNPDLTVPTPRGTAPGNGQLTAVVARTTGIAPTVTGKPGPGLFQTAIRRAAGGPARAEGRSAQGRSAEQVLVVGDRLDTDIAGAVAAGLKSLLVLTGVSGLADLLAAEPAERPTFWLPTCPGSGSLSPRWPRSVVGGSAGRPGHASLTVGWRWVDAGRQQGCAGPDHAAAGSVWTAGERPCSGLDRRRPRGQT